MTTDNQKKTSGQGPGNRPSRAPAKGQPERTRPVARLPSRRRMPPPPPGQTVPAGAARRKKQAVPATPVKLTMLGGLNEIGKNITLFEYGDDAFLIDCGMAFPDDEMLGVDIVLPDFTYVEKNRDRIKGIVLTHGHEDHIGGLPYLLKQMNFPIYGTKLTLALVDSKLREHGLSGKVRLNVVEPGGVIQFGAVSVEFIHVNHSIPDAVALGIKTPLGYVVHTGDFKIDCTPIMGENDGSRPAGGARQRGRARPSGRLHQRRAPRLYAERAGGGGQFRQPVQKRRKTSGSSSRRFPPTSTASSRSSTPRRRTGGRWPSRGGVCSILSVLRPSSGI